MFLDIMCVALGLAIIFLIGFLIKIVYLIVTNPNPSKNKNKDVNVDENDEKSGYGKLVGNAFQNNDKQIINIPLDDYPEYADEIIALSDIDNQISELTQNFANIEIDYKDTNIADILEEANSRLMEAHETFGNNALLFKHRLNTKNASANLNKLLDQERIIVSDISDMLDSLLSYIEHSELTEQVDIKSFSDSLKEFNKF